MYKRNTDEIETMMVFRFRRFVQVYR